MYRSQLLCIALLVWHNVALAAPDPQELLIATDSIRNPGRPFSVKLTLTEFDAGKQVDTSVLESYSRSRDDGGQFASIVRFVMPARDFGKLMLRNGDDMWFFDPNTKASVRLSPQQRLLGQASNGDVVTVNLAKDYLAKLTAEEEVVDGERRRRNSYKLALTANTPTATYAAVDLWVDAENSRPIKARFYAESGRLLKTVYYRRYEQQLGKERPTETVIIDGLNPQSVTLIRYSDFATPAIPLTWFNRDYLPNFRPN